MLKYDQKKYDRVSRLSNPVLEGIMHEHGESFIMMSRKDMIDEVYSYGDLVIENENQC